MSGPLGILLAFALFLALPVSSVASTAAPPLRSITVVSDDNYPPFIFLNQSGQPEGYLVDLWKLWEKKTGIAVNLRPLPWGEAQQRALNGQADVIETIFKTPGREPFYDFTQGYAKLPVAIYTDKSISGIRDTASLQGFLVGVLDGDACIEHLQRAGVSNLKRYSHYAKVIEAAKAQTIKIFCMDEYPANFYLYQTGSHRDFIKAFDLYQGEFHRAVPKGHPETLAIVEKGMALLGDEETELRDRWMGRSTDWLLYARITGVVLAGLLVAAFGLMLWVRMLRSAVARKTIELEQEKTKLGESESRFRAFFENNKSMMLVIDPESGKIVDANNVAVEFYGYPRQTLVSLLISQINTLQPEEIYQERQRALREERSYFSFRHRLASGEVRDVEVYSTPVVSNGRALLFSVVHDITQRNQVEAALRDSEALFRTLAALAPVGIYLAASNGECIYANKRWCEMAGLSSSAVLGGGWLAGIHPDDRERVVADWQRMVTTNGDWSDEYRFCTPEGNVTWVYGLATQQRDAAGKVVKFIGVNLDITERKRAEAELNLHRHHLEELVEARTADLERANQALTLAKEAAESASRAKSAFLSNMSHEIRTPMNAVVGMTHILRRSGLNPAQIDSLSKIEAASQHLMEVINDILDLSKIEAGKLVVEALPLSVNSLLTEIQSLMSARAQEKGLTLQVACDAFPIDLQGDPTRLRQAILNYVNNAIKFTKFGTVTLRARKVSEDEQGVEVRFEVEDTGIGIPANVLPRLFSPFEQADNSTTRQYGGTGLGLVITRRLAEIMGGSAGVESLLGVGSTFWFSARLEKKRWDFSRIAGQNVDPELLIRQNFSGWRLLIVDDEPVNLEIAEFFLEGSGLLVDTAQDGAEAVERAKKEHYALILMDVQMPTLDGLTATRRIRELPDYRNTPILAMTANAFAEEKAPCLEAGMNDFMAKPFDAYTLLEILLKHLRRAASGQNQTP